MLFVSEYLCSGALSGTEFTPGLLTEGEAMWRAVLEDALQLPDLSVCTTCDARFQPLRHPRLQTVLIETREQEADHFERLARQADQVLLIAPELDHLLLRRCQQLERWGCDGLMSDIAAVELTSDKLLFFQRCQQVGIPTPPTWELPEPWPERWEWGFPALIKPRFGAGSTATFAVESAEDWARLRQAEPRKLLAPSLVQPLLAGKPASLICLVDPLEGNRQWLPAGWQEFERLRYRGGSIPVEQALQSRLRELCERALEWMPGLRGYIGFDCWVETATEGTVKAERGATPEAATSAEFPRVQLLEINPRVTTSYLGYRQLARFSLVEWMLGRRPLPAAVWREASVRFTAGGEVELC